MPWYEVVNKITIAGIGTKTVVKTVEAADPCDAIRVAQADMVTISVTRTLEVAPPALPVEQPIL